MEDATGLTAAGFRVLGGRVLAGLAAVGLALGTGALAVEYPATETELAEALRRLGPPGVLWGRLAIEEESPDGAWTPLGGVPVDVYPAIPSLVAELEGIRRSARGSGAEYESAVGRFQAALAALQARLRSARGDPPLEATPRDRPEGPAPVRGSETAAKLRPSGKRGEASKAEEAKVEAPKAEEAIPASPTRQTTDPGGLFVFENLPSGDWLLVGVRVTPYGQSKAQPKPQSSRRTQSFLPAPPKVAKEAEVWVARVRVGPGERVRLVLTDRARWMVGPVY